MEKCNKNLNYSYNIYTAIDLCSQKLKSVSNSGGQGSLTDLNWGVANMGDARISQVKYEQIAKFHQLNMN